MKFFCKIGTMLLASIFIVSSVSIPAQASTLDWRHEIHYEDKKHEIHYDGHDRWDKNPGWNDKQDPVLPESEPEVPEITPETEPEVTTEQISLLGVYVLKQGVPADLDLTQSTASSYWTLVDYDVTNVTVTLGEGELLVTNVENYTTASVTIADNTAFLTALNTAVTGAANDDTYVLEWQKIILENDGYHLDCIAYVPEYSITLVSNMEGVTFSNVGVLKNDIISFPEIPTVEGYEFENWYTDEACTNVYDKTTQIKNSFTLYGKWVEKKEEVILPVEPIDPPAPDQPKDTTMAPEEPKEEIPTETETAETPVEETPTQPEQLSTPSETITAEPEVTPTPAPAVESTLIVEEIVPTVTIVEETIPQEETVTVEEEVSPFENLILEEDVEIEIEDNEIPLAKTEEKECVIHLLMYVLIILYCLSFAIMGFLPQKSDKKYYIARFAACVIVISLSILMLVPECSLDFFVYLLGLMVCLSGFMGAKHFHENTDEK